MFQVSLKVISDWLDPSHNLLHIWAVGATSTLHYVWSSLGPPAVLLVATNTPNSTLSVNWSLLISSEPDGGLMVLPKESIQFSSAIVFTRVRRLGENQGEECGGEGSFELEGETRLGVGEVVSGMRAWGGASERVVVVIQEKAGLRQA